jgi:Ni/Co efflux regulator RcnB
MKNILKASLAILMLAAPMSEAMAQGWNNNRYERHDDRRDDRRGPAMRDHRDFGHHNWRKGGRIDRSDWNRGRRVSDWRRYHLQRPPRGYEWRQVDNQFVLAAAATGLIAALVLANQ